VNEERWGGPYGTGLFRVKVVRADGELASPGTHVLDVRAGNWVAALKDAGCRSTDFRYEQEQEGSVSTTGMKNESAEWARRRTLLISHLHYHPDHARHYGPGHDFVLSGTVDIVEEHERLHAEPVHGVSHPHATGLEVRGESMKNTTGNLTPHQEALARALHRNELELKVTVACADADPDAVLVKMPRETLRLNSSPYTLKVTSISRADGQPFGLEGAFEEFWLSKAGSTETVKEAVRDAFRYGVSWGREHA
jgi:hypothetical protein